MALPAIRKITLPDENAPKTEWIARSRTLARECNRGREMATPGATRWGNLKRAALTNITVGFSGRLEAMLDEIPASVELWGMKFTPSDIVPAVNVALGVAGMFGWLRGGSRIAFEVGNAYWNAKAYEMAKGDSSPTAGA